MTGDHQYTRRRLMSTAGAASIAVLAGCAGGNGDDEAGSTTAGEMADGGAMTDDGMTDDGMTDDGMSDEGMTDDGMADDGTTTASGEMTEEGSMDGGAMDPMAADRVTVDRFSEDAGTLMVRSDANDLPGPGEPVDFDRAPFLTHGLGPEGGHVTYYNFDVQPTEPAPIYVLFREGEDAPIPDQLNIVDVVPGDEGYTDFWQVTTVTVPSHYEANTATSLEDLEAAGYDMETTPMLVNCPVVPEGSTAAMRAGDGDAGLVEGWYRGQVLSYLRFTEASLHVAGGAVPRSPIYVTFNENPGMEGGGPASGFVMESGSTRTHNVLATLPGEDGYSPLWTVSVYDNADFEAVSDLASATDANVLDRGVANVNCPVVETP
ncbi:MAG: hypothetical protein V5A18_06450 [Haloarculaceae archaeon]